ncbi:MAG TPA: PadR family transcriptional regulator [Chloroflexota bacterium]|nr:PadR family transcriptional regulator [Chloroflexota bacterium]
MEKTSGIRVHNDLISLAVLALLAEQPRHPYEMQRLLRERHNDFAVGKTRSFYDAVNRLVRHGLVEPGDTTREGKHPERTIYHLTDHGRLKFEGWLEYLLITPVTEFPAFMVALSFLGYFTPPEGARMLRARAETLEARAGGLADALEKLMGEGGLPRVVLLEQEHALALLRAELVWVRALVDDMEAGRLVWSWERNLAPDHAGRQVEKGSGET